MRKQFFQGIEDGCSMDDSIGIYDGRKRGKLSYMPTRKFTTEILNAAILGLESQKDKLDVQIAELRQMVDGNRPAPAAAPEVAPRKRRKLSRAARARIAAAQRKRWAEAKKLSGAPAAPKAPRRKRRLSAAGRKAIGDATRKRWAAVRAAKKTKSA